MSGLLQQHGLSLVSNPRIDIGLYCRVADDGCWLTIRTLVRAQPFGVQLVFSLLNSVTSLAVSCTKKIEHGFRGPTSSRSLRRFLFGQDFILGVISSEEFN